MENLKGSNYSWGLVAKIFHWTLAVFILSQILLIKELRGKNLT